MAILLRPPLRALVVVNRCFLRTHPGTPDIYRAGVRYDEEENHYTDGIEHFDPIPDCIPRGWGDCDDLAPWLVAQCNERGEPARERLTWRRNRHGQRVFHVVVRRCVYDARRRLWSWGPVEDPSAKLGMPVY